MNINNVSRAIVDNAKSGMWLIATYQLDTPSGVKYVRVKAFGKWVQRIECENICDSIPEQKTNKALKIEVEKLLNYIANN